MIKPTARISPFVIERLAKYYLYLKTISDSHENSWISSKDIATVLELTSSTVRQDISYLSEYKGISKKGYNILELITTLEAVIGTTPPRRAVIVGAGNFGRALLLHQEFRKQGFEIQAIFDANSALIGTSVDNFSIQNITNLEKIIRENHIQIGIIAVPEHSAQKVADMLIDAGVKGILNLTAKMLQIPAHVVIVSSRIIIDLMKLSFQIKNLNNNGHSEVYAEEGRLYGG